MRNLVVCLSTACLMFTGAARAATLQQVSIDEMTSKATAIVHARVTGHFATAKGPTIFTHYQLQVEEVLKGGPAGPSEVLLPGGSAGTLNQTFAGVPKLTEGKDYLLFLWTSKGLTQLIGFSQGMFEVTQDSSGTPMVVRPATTEMMLNRTGTPVQDRPLKMPLAQFKARVNSLLGRSSK